jgi:hypothetical protein
MSSLTLVGSPLSALVCGRFYVGSSRAVPVAFRVRVIRDRICREADYRKSCWMSILVLFGWAEADILAVLADFQNPADLLRLPIRQFPDLYITVT